MLCVCVGYCFKFVLGERTHSGINQSLFCFSSVRGELEVQVLYLPDPHVWDPRLYSHSASEKSSYKPGKVILKPNPFLHL